MYQRNRTDRMQNDIDDREEEENLHREIYGQQKRRPGNWLRKFGEPSTVIALLVLFATSGLFWATSVLVIQAKRSFEEGNRAWLAPTAASLMSKTENGKPINIGLQYNNVGRAPAADVNISYRLYVFPNEEIDNGKAMATIAGDDVCDRVEPVSGSAVVYPGPGGSRLILTISPTEAQAGKRTLYDTYMDGNHALAAHFCIAYRTFSGTHKSAFCYFHRPDTGGGLNWNQCSLGNHAD